MKKRGFIFAFMCFFSLEIFASGHLVNITKTDVKCNGENTGSAVANVSGGTGPFIYLWSNGSTGTTVNALTAGSYTCTVTDNNDLSTAISAVIITEPTAIVYNGTITDATCGQNNGYVSAEISNGSGIPPYSYTWSSGSTQSYLNNLSAGSYTVTATDANGCTASAVATVGSYNPAVASITVVSKSCNGTNTGSLTATLIGGTAASYVWSDSQTTQTVSGLAVGTYTVTIADIYGCFSISSATITQSPQLTCSLFVTDATCAQSNNGTATVLDGVPGYSYMWSSTTQTTTTVTGLSAGTYSLTITDVNGCTVIKGFSISIGGIGFGLTGIDATCGQSNGYVSVGVSNGAGTPPYSYTWSSGSTQSYSDNLSAGTYSVTVTDAIGCTASAVATVGSYNPAVASVTVASNVSCNGTNTGSLTATLSGGTAVSYIWSTTLTTQAASGLSAGTYSVTITDTNGCKSSGSATINEPAAIVVSITTTNAACGQSNGAATASVIGGSPGYNYTWFTGTQTTATVTGLSAGAYSLTVTDVNGCTGITSFSISASAGPTVSTSKTDATCGQSNGSVTVTANGGTGVLTYNWYFGYGQSTASNLSAGSYTVTVTDSNGCTATSIATISDTSSPNNANWTSPDTVCVGSAFSLNDYLSGSATLGGTWSGTGVSADNFYPGIPGNYNITYTVAKGTSCEISQTHSIHVIVDKINNATWNTPVWVCSGTTYDLNTYLTAASTKGGTWSGTGVTGNNFTANAAGAYSITYSVTGSHCVKKVVQTINVLVDSTKNANWSIPVDTSCTYNLNNYLDPMATWGGQWSGQNVFGDYFIPNGPGTYNVTYTLAPGTLCEAKVTKSININFAAEEITRLTDSCKLVWPGDADRDLIANNKDILSIGVAYGSTGPIRDSISTDTLGYVWALQQVNTNWVGQWAKSWGVKLSNGIDYKNVDCNGDGTIDVNDTIAVIKNYGRTHNFKEAEPVYINGLPDLTFNFPMDTVNTGAGLSVPIILGTSSSPANGVYGVAFTISYDPSIIDTSEIGVSLNGSWLGTSGTNLISITKSFSSYGQMDIAIVRTNHQDVSGSGKIAELNLRLKDDMSGQPSGTVYKKLILETSKLHSINATEVIVPLNVGRDSVIIKNTGPLGIQQHVRIGSVKIYPNPASGIINVDVSMADIQTIQLVNILGETVKLINSNIGNRTTIDTQSLPAGIYYLSVASSRERIVKPVHIIKY